MDEILEEAQRQDEAIVKSFFSKHLAWVDGYTPGSDIPKINWKTFMRELNKFPDIVFYETGIGNYIPLFYMILVPKVPLRVVERLLEINETGAANYALWSDEDANEWNIFQWMQWANLTTISPEILTFLVRKAPFAVCDVHAEKTESPLYFFIAAGERKLTEQVEAILSASLCATSTVLSNHFTGERKVPAAVLNFALDAALRRERAGRSIFGWVFTHDEE